MTPEVPWAVSMLDHSSSEEIFPNIQPNFSYYQLIPGLVPWTAHTAQSTAFLFSGFPSWGETKMSSANSLRDVLGNTQVPRGEFWVKTRIWEDERSCTVRNWPLCSYDMEIAVLSCWSVHWPKQKSWKYSWNYLCLYNQATSMQNCFLMTHHSALFVFSRQPADWEELLDLRFLPGSLYKHLNFISCL